MQEPPHTPWSRFREPLSACAVLVACWFSAWQPHMAQADDVAALQGFDAASAHAHDADSLSTIIEEESDRHVSCCDDGSCDRCDRPFLRIRDRLTIGAEYLLLRPTLGNATALYQTTTSSRTRLSNTALNYEFAYSSGVRGFLACRLNDDWMVRFGYLAIGSSDSLSGVSSGNWIGGNGTGFIGPYDTVATVAGQSIQSRMDVGLNVYDLEIAGRLAAPECAADGRASAWEAAAAVGLRFADVSIDSAVFNDQTALGQLNQVFVTTSQGFHGMGPRLALQGRRYLGRNRRWSGFASGGAALLVGAYDNTDTRLRRRDEGGGLISTNLQSQHDTGTVVAPNLDLSLGATWQWSQRTALSFGWLLMYWGEVGYAEGISTATANPVPLPDFVPLANSSLSFDGAFFKLTHSF